MSTIQLKRGNNANFKNVVLLSGEPAFVVDTKKLYIGDGAQNVLINPVDKINGLNTTDSFSKFTVNEYGQITKAEKLLESDLPSISAMKITGLGTAAMVNTGSSAGEIPTLDQNGKLSLNVIPDTALVQVFEVSSEAAMLALNAQPGDVAVRSDISANFILKTSPASALGNWVKLLVPADAVSSVNGKTGIVVVYASDITLKDYVKAAAYAAITAGDTVNQAIGKLEKNFDNYALLASPAFSGAPTAPTPDGGDSSTKIATTSFVKTAINVIDGGTF